MIACYNYMSGQSEAPYYFSRMHNTSLSSFQFLNF